ncbi:GGDEF domain-containing protein [Pseudomonas oryzihabitans]|uniref:GGDEF domain-containing protein n=1 Tax=Pseudomonas oryzihabitans TaxID=47885 RepID=UPI001F52A319|nr:GGDEF domain-containing protein [Pseudomonas oryzihabitans]MCI1009917.1 GGDEF domain-containing protein [Pseudomonas oryzihabitans]
MALDAPTLLTITIALAAAAAGYLAIEWRSVRESALLYWSAGFALICVGSTLALLRSQGLLLVGIWFANGLLIFVHGLFLLGVARFTGRRLSLGWWAIAALWLGLLLLPNEPWWSKVMLVVQSFLIGILAIRAGLLLRRRNAGERQLRAVLLIHGLFYLTKMIPPLTPGTLIDLAVYRGAIIQISLVEGVMAVMLIALSMTGTVRYRREQRIERLAGSDPLTGLHNRRALETEAPRLFGMTTPERPGALLLIDLDNFKLANDLYGHAAGDGLLIALSELLRATLPRRALAARLGGDEFVALLGGLSQAEVIALADGLRERFSLLATQRLATPERVTLSIGAVLFDHPPRSLADLLAQGDRALYEAKRGGRDGVRVSKG